MNSEKLKDLAVNSLENLKALDIAVLDVRGKANFTDFMLVCSGSSDRHLRAIANEVHVDAKNAGNPPIAIDGEDSKDWILVDLGDVIVHIMRPDIRDLYEIEKLWSLGKHREVSAE